MPYYSGDYYRGDYYQAGGLFGTLGKIAKSVIRVTPLGRVAEALLPSVFAPPKTQPGTALAPTGGGIPIIRSPGFRGFTERLLPGGRTGYMTDPSYNPETGMTYTEYPGYRRRRMNFMNDKALRRAGRRIDGFVRSSRKVLKHTNYVLVRRGSGRKKGKR